LLGRQAREHAVRLFDALAEPFPVYVYERDRLVVRLKLVEDVDASLAARALEAVEPHTFWNEEFLDRRVRIYETVGHPRLAVAQRELDRFRRDRVD
jgi:hypothetical protein